MTCARRPLAAALALCAGGLFWGAAPGTVPAAVHPARQGDGRADTIAVVALPDVSRLHPAVQRQVQDAYETLAPGALDADASAPDRSDAYGELGTIFLAVGLLDDAERCLRNATLLAPTTFRWWYLRGHAQRRQGALEEAVGSFERAHQVDPVDLAASVWLVRGLHDLGRLDEAGAVAAALAAAHPDAPAVRFEAGRVALATDEHRDAVAHLEATLALDPEATVVHYPLATAYRRLGDRDRADDHLARRGGRGATAGVTPRLSDPLLAALTGLLPSPQQQRDLAFDAAANGDWPDAVRRFRRAVAAAPDVARLRLNLAWALERTGDVAEAVTELEVALRLEPGLARAHHDLGRLHARDGRDETAIEHFRAAVDGSPTFTAAHLDLADTLRRTDRVGASLAHYRRGLDLDPGDRRARFGETMALVRLDRYAEARDRLRVAITVHPDGTEFTHALARLLAAAPEAGVRDGVEALVLAAGLAERQQTTAVAETMAMALAEVGSYDQAAEWQRIAMSIATRAGRPDVAQQMATNLARYVARQPCRTPWRDDDPDLRPGPPAAPGPPAVTGPE